MTMTIKTARAAGLFSLALLLAGFAAMPAQASSILSEKPGMGSGMDSGKRYDCDSRQEVKYAFKKLGLRDIDVSKTHDYYVYRVSGKLPAEAAAVREEAFSNDLLSTKKSHDYIRYVVIYDGCEHEIIQQLQPREKAMSLPM
jgi:hypothetical protein